MGKLKTSKRVPCKYGAACYRKNKKHLDEFSHPDDEGGGDLKVYIVNLYFSFDILISLIIFALPLALKFDKSA